MSDPTPYRGRPHSPWQPGTQPYERSSHGQPAYGPPPQQAYDSHPSVDLPLASIPRRAGARIMDNGLVAVFGFALILPIAIGALGLDDAGSKTKDEGGVWTWPIISILFVVLSVLPFLYEAVQLALWGQTLGKRWFGLRVVKTNPPGEPLEVVGGVWRAAINHVGYQLGFFFFLILTVKVFGLAAYGLLLVSLGVLMAYLWAIWDRPLHQALHDRFAGTVVIDDRAEWE